MNITCLFRTWPYSCIWLRNTVKCTNNNNGVAIKALTTLDEPERIEIQIVLVLWHIHHCWLFCAKSSFYINIKYDL